MSTIVDRLDYTGMVALVTGGSKGIGRAVVEGLLHLGADVVFTYRTEDESVASLCAIAGFKGRATGVRSDATEKSAADRLREHITAHTGHLDILVNNVGDAVGRSPFASSSDDLWRRSLELNLMTAVSTTRAFIPMLRESTSGAIVNVSSIAGSTGGPGDSTHYGAAKAAMNAMTGALAKELKGTGIRVNGVAPSAIQTDFQKRHSSAERLERVRAETPLGRIGTATEVSDLIIFLASPAAGYVNGETVHVTGGR